MISASQLFFKRLFDLLLALLLLPIVMPILFILVGIAAIDVGKFGWFQQERVGQKGELFNIYKIRTLRAEPHFFGHLDQSASKIGKFLRQSKLDELPQLFNVLFGHMSFVGPRPDVQGFADELVGNDRIILIVKPGVTGPATLKYKDEEAVLAKQSDPETYNRTIIWVDKVDINKKYVKNWSFYLDLKYIIQSIIN